MKLSDHAAAMNPGPAQTVLLFAANRYEPFPRHQCALYIDNMTADELRQALMVALEYLASQ